METKLSNSDLPALNIRLEKALKIIEVIDYLFVTQRKVIFDSALHQADICERTSERLTKKLLSKKF